MRNTVRVFEDLELSSSTPVVVVAHVRALVAALVHDWSDSSVELSVD